jgi:5-methylcytosine-specific restriction enzyme A
MIKRAVDILTGKAPLKAKRSPKWQTVRKNFLKSHGECAVCGGKTKLEVHHIKPFHEYPELELEEENLITLCESDSGGVVCHLFFGHLGDYKKINPDVLDDAKEWRQRLDFN